MASTRHISRISSGRQTREERRLGVSDHQEPRQKPEAKVLHIQPAQDGISKVRQRNMNASKNHIERIRHAAEKQKDTLNVRVKKNGLKRRKTMREEEEEIPLLSHEVVLEPSFQYNPVELINSFPINPMVHFPEAPLYIPIVLDAPVLNVPRVVEPLLLLEAPPMTEEQTQTKRKRENRLARKAYLSLTNLVNIVKRFFSDDE